MKNTIHLHFSNGDCKVVNNWKEASRYTYHVAHVVSPEGRIVKKVYYY